MGVLCCSDLHLETKAILASVTCDMHMPVVANDVLQLIDSGNGTAHKIANVITQDQSLTLRVLKMANSPFYGFSRKINTVKDAVVVLGEKILRNMVLVMVVRGMHIRQGAVERTMWEESAAYAMAARFIALKADCHHPEEAFLAGLMSNVGELVCNNDKSQLYVRILDDSRASGKREECSRVLLAYPFTHLGAALLFDWNFSPLMVASTFYAEESELTGDCADEMFLMCSVVYLARKLCQNLGLGSYQKQKQPLFGGYAATVLGFDAAAIAALHDEFALMFDEKSSALIQF